MSNGYNGWRNRETWVVNLWFGDYFSDLVSENGKIDAAFIEEMINEHVADKIGDDGFLADLLDLPAIDYEELAESYNSEVEDEDAD